VERVTQLVAKVRQARFSKYLIAGGLTVSIEYGSFAALFAFSNGKHVAIANSISYGLGLISSFLLNRFWVFNHGQHKAVGHQAIQYGVLIAVNLALTNGIIFVLDQMGVTPYIGKIVAMGAVVIWNFVLYQKIIFKKQAPTE
jgi:putative flippase GtrA